MDRRLLGWCVVGLVGCSSPAGVDGGAPVLVVGERSFSREELSKLIRLQPEILRARLSTEEGKDEFVEQLIQSELLVQEARRRGLDRAPEVKQMVDRLMVQKLAESTVPVAPDEATLRAVYEASRNEFVKPDRFHVAAVLFSAVGPDKQKVKQEAVAAAARLAALKGSERVRRFEQLARERSDDPGSRAAGGDLGPRSPEDLALVLGAGLEGALGSLKEAGQLVGPVETDRGVVLLLLRGIQPGLSQTFESVRPRLEQRLMAEARATALRELVTKLRASTRVEVVSGDGGL